MGMDSEVDFLDGVLVLAGDRKLVDHLGSVRADDVGAEYLAVLRVANDLDEALGLAGGAGAGVGRERKPPNFVVDLLLLHLRFGHADRRHLRVAVGRIRNVAVIDLVHVLLASEKLGEDDAFTLAFVGEHWRTGDIADGVDPFDRSLHPLVDLDEAAVGELNAQLLDADVLDDWSAASGDENFFHFEVLFLAANVNAHRDRILADLDVADFGARQHVDFPLLEAAGELGAAVSVFERKNSRQDFYQGDLRSKGG